MEREDLNWWDLHHNRTHQPTTKPPKHPLEPQPGPNNPRASTSNTRSKPQDQAFPSTYKCPSSSLSP
eukprot:c17828_g1_i1 orf=3-200(-)